MNIQLVMDNDNEGQKSDGAAQGIVPSTDKTATQTEYLIRVRCEKSADGSRSCKIQDISVDSPVMDQPLQKPGENSQKESKPAVAVASEGQTVADAKAQNPSECTLCDILEAVVAPMKDMQPVPRRFTSWRREEKVIP